MFRWCVVEMVGQSPECVWGFDTYEEAKSVAGEDPAYILFFIEDWEDRLTHEGKD